MGVRFMAPPSGEGLLFRLAGELDAHGHGSIERRRYDAPAAGSHE